MTTSAKKFGRFAPSPSGELHFGNLRTALAAQQLARHEGLGLRLRIDDLDPDRSRSKWEQSQIADLRAIGLEWEEPIIRQTDRLDQYARAIEQLAGRSLIYPCFCSRADVREAAQAPHGRPDGWYPGTCRAISPDDARKRIEKGDGHSLRARAEGSECAYDDQLLGHIATPIDDFVVQRRDGVAAYNLACAVDDGEPEITQVVRGADLAETTARQLWVMHKLGLEVPRYAHVPIVVGPDNHRLAKRHGSVTLRELAQQGIAATAVRDYLIKSLVGEQISHEPLVFTVANLR